MTYAFLTIKRADDGRQMVDRPRATDVIGHTLRDTFNEEDSVPCEFARLLRRLDGVPHRLN